MPSIRQSYDPIVVIYQRVIEQNANYLSDELQNILSGKGQVSHGTFIQTIARYLGTGPSASPMVQEDQHDKHQETEKLTAYIEQHGYWVKNINR